VSFDNLFLTAPDSDRGPRIVIDERLGFDTNGQEWTIRVAPVDTTRPMRITLAWTDAPGAAGANPALLNDLDLEVTETATGDVFRGNVFNNGFSTTGGAFDTLNNVECVYVAAPDGVYDVTVIAGTLRADARPPFAAATPWQDFAIVLDNAEVPAGQPVNVALAIDRSGSMVSSGYVDVTRTAARSFVDLMAIDDAVGVASFGSTATDDFPATTPASLRTITTQADRDAAKAAIDGLAFGGSTMMGPGLQRAAAMLPGGSGRKAIVLLSDGYDNGVPDARTVAGGLAADVAIYSCAMGSLSDQTLLEDIADSTSGRYFYMPTIDDLFLILNVIREQVTGDGLVVNEQHTASSSRVGAFIEAAASEATFLVDWAVPGLAWVPREAKKASDVNVRLRMPNGKLLHPYDPSVRRLEGTGYVAFRVEDPLPGQWWVEVSTVRAAHTLYSVGVFVRSPIRIDATISPRRPLRGSPLEVTVDVWDGTRGVTDLTGTVCVTVPSSSPDRLVANFGRRLKTLNPLRAVRRDPVPEAFREALAISTSLLKEGRQAITHETRCTPLKRPSPAGSGIGQPGGGSGGGVVVTPVGGGGGGVVVAPGGGGGGIVVGSDEAASIVVSRARLARTPGAALSALLLTLGPTTLSAAHPGAAHPGSANAKVTVQGTTLGGSRFVRTTTRSVRVG
jgi:Mg-chelatase subunit ChlD